MLQVYESIILIYNIILYKIIKVLPDLFWSSVRIQCGAKIFSMLHFVVALASVRTTICSV